MRSACEIRSTAAVTSSRSTLRAVSARLAWSAASAASNSVWSIGKSGATATSAPELPPSRARRYSSRAAAWSSGKPSKPSACANRTTVELEVFARRANSSAVANAASSKWSTMYWPTSFCERENSSKRWRISSVSVTAGLTERVTADCFVPATVVPSLAVRLACALALFLALAAPASAAFPSKCGAAPVCGTDEGDDVFFTGEPAAIQFFGENGHDTVAGSVFGDRLVGGGGNDVLYGDRGDDVLDGGDDSDLVFGGPGNDTLRERRFGFDRLYGGAGDDVLAGGRANDRLYGGPGNDVLYGGSGTDRLFGGPGDDKLYGGPNRDSFDCGPGDDTVYYTH